MFTFIWFLLFVVASATLLNFFHWFGKLVHLRRQVHHVKRELKSMNVLNYDSSSLKQFTQSYLQRDGLLILRLVSKNAGDIIAAELLLGLWKNYAPKLKNNSNKSKRKKNKRADETQPILNHDDIV